MASVPGSETSGSGKDDRLQQKHSSDSVEEVFSRFLGNEKQSTKSGTTGSLDEAYSRFVDCEKLASQSHNGKEYSKVARDAIDFKMMSLRTMKSLVEASRQMEPGAPFEMPRLDNVQEEDVAVWTHFVEVINNVIRRSSDSSTSRDDTDSGPAHVPVPVPSAVPVKRESIQSVPSGSCQAQPQPPRSPSYDADSDIEIIETLSIQERPAVPAGTASAPSSGSDRSSSPSSLPASPTSAITSGASTSQDVTTLPLQLQTKSSVRIAPSPVKVCTASAPSNIGTTHPQRPSITSPVATAQSPAVSTTGAPTSRDTALFLQPSTTSPSHVTLPSTRDSTMDMPSTSGLNQGVTIPLQTSAIPSLRAASSPAKAITTGASTNQGATLPLQPSSSTALAAPSTAKARTASAHNNGILQYLKSSTPQGSTPVKRPLSKTKEVSKPAEVIDIGSDDSTVVEETVQKGEEPTNDVNAIVVTDDEDDIVIVEEVAIDGVREKNTRDTIPPAAAPGANDAHSHELENEKDAQETVDAVDQPTGSAVDAGEPATGSSDTVPSRGVTPVNVVAGNLETAMQATFSLGELDEFTPTSASTPKPNKKRKRGELARLHIDMVNVEMAERKRGTPHKGQSEAKSAKEELPDAVEVSRSQCKKFSPKRQMTAAFDEWKMTQLSRIKRGRPADTASRAFIPSHAGRGGGSKWSCGGTTCKEEFDTREKVYSHMLSEHNEDGEIKCKCLDCGFISTFQNVVVHRKENPACSTVHSFLAYWHEKKDNDPHYRWFQRVKEIMLYCAFPECPRSCTSDGKPFAKVEEVQEHHRKIHGYYVYYKCMEVDKMVGCGKTFHFPSTYFQHMITNCDESMPQFVARKWRKGNIDNEEKEDTVASG